LRWIKQIYIFKLSFVFLTAWAAFLSLSASHSVMHIIYIYISTPSVYMDLLAGDQVCINICLFVQFFYLLSLFLFAHSIQSVKHQVVLYIYIHIHICIYIYDAYTVFQAKKTFWRTSKRLFDNLSFLSFFLSSFSILAYCQLIETYILNVAVFRTRMLWADEYIYIYVCAVDLFLFYPVLPFLAIVILFSDLYVCLFFSSFIIFWWAHRKCVKKD